MEDSQLLQLLRSDPGAGCDALLRQYGGLIQGVLRRALPGLPQDAEECAADVLVAAWRHAGALLEQQTPLRPWLIVTARNAGIDRLRQLGRLAETPLDEALALPGSSPECDAACRDRDQLVQELVAAMPMPDRAIFQRKYWLLQSSKEIAAALGLEVSNINTRLYRGRKQLRARLQRELDLEGGCSV